MSSLFAHVFTKIFPMPKILSFDFVGVDLSLDTVRVMQLKDTRMGKIPWKYKEYPLKQKCSLFDVNPSENNCSELANVLQKVMKDFGVYYVNVSIPELKTYTYQTTVPRSAETNINEIILYSIVDNIPLSPQEALIDPYISKRSKNSMEVIVSAIPNKVIELYTGFFEKVGLKPIAFEPETHAISRGIIKKGDNNPYLVLNLDGDISTISVIEDALVQFTQTLSVSRGDFKDGFKNQAAAELKDSINKIIIYWFTSRSKSNDDKIQNMYLVGSGGGSNDLVNFLEKNLSVNVQFANVWANCFDLEKYIPNIHAKDSLKYATSVGLALKELK
jgi:Tfp pilus assembly PilM family ATPase